MTGLLSGRDLTLLRGDRCLFSSLEFALNPGELLVIEGANGSGKTSLLRGIAGLLEFETGSISWGGKQVRHHYQDFRNELVWLSHRVGFKADLNLIENLKFETGLRRSNYALIESVCDRLNLGQLTELPLRSLSAGQQRRVALARLPLARARLWMMDEPFTNLDKAGHSIVEELIDEHISQGGLCIVASHQALNAGEGSRRLQLS